MTSSSKAAVPAELGRRGKRLAAARARLNGWFTVPFPRRRNRAAAPGPAAEPTGALRAFRSAALWAIAVLTATADGAAFTESYRGLFEWAEHHGLSGFWAAAFPLQVDLFIVIGELVLFIAMVGRWGWRDRAGAWAVALLGLAVSVAGNVGHVAVHDLQSRGTAAVPPVAAFGALWLGLGVLKRIVRNRDRPAAGGEGTAPGGALDSVPAVDLAGLLGGLAEAVRALAERPAAEVPAPASRADEAALLAELLAAVRDVGERVGGMVSTAGERADETALLAGLAEAVRDLASRVGGMSSAPVPVGAEHAALIAYRATLAAGNPYSMNALQVRFGLTRAQAEKVRAAIADEHGQAPADVNGHQLEAAGTQSGSSQ